MNFFRMSFSGLQYPWRVDNARPNKFLPSVFFPECGHTAAMPGEMPLDVAPLYDWSGGAGAEVVDLECWIALRNAILEEIARSNRPVPPIWPGMRVGPLHLNLFCHGEPPAIFHTGVNFLFSDTIVDLFRTRKFKGGDFYPAHVQGKCKGEPRAKSLPYYELVAIAELPMAVQGNLRETKCAECGTLLDSQFDALVLEQSEDSEVDFVRLKGTTSTLVSERVKSAIEEAGLSCVVFIPSQRIGLGPGCKSLSEIMADLKFEKQRERRIGKGRCDGF